MDALMHDTTHALAIGAGATLLTDAWVWIRQHGLRVSPPDWGLVGRWIAHMASGRFRHDRIATAKAVRGERLIGWVAHFLIGIIFAALFMAVAGQAWTRQPTLGPALVFGVITVAAPFLLMQPGMGSGIAARRTPRPNAARLQSLVTHAVFGLGLYLSALVFNVFTGE